MYITTTRQNVQRTGGKGLGGEYGYFIYETRDDHPEAGIEMIGKAASLEAALRLFEVLSGKKA